MTPRMTAQEYREAHAANFKSGTTAAKSAKKKKPRKTKIKNTFGSEDAFQIAASRHLRAIVPARFPWTAVEPAGVGVRAGKRRKAKGVNPGWMDIQFALPPFGTYLGLELKAEGGSPSASQKETGALITAAGGFWFPVKTLGDIDFVLRSFGIIDGTPSMESPRPHLVKLVQAANLGWFRDLVEQQG